MFCLRIKVKYFRIIFNTAPPPYLELCWMLHVRQNSTEGYLNWWTVLSCSIIRGRPFIHRFLFSFVLMVQVYKLTQNTRALNSVRWKSNKKYTYKTNFGYIKF